MKIWLLTTVICACSFWAFSQKRNTDVLPDTVRLTKKERLKRQKEANEEKEESYKEQQKREKEAANAGAFV